MPVVRDLEQLHAKSEYARMRPGYITACMSNSTQAHSLL